LTCQAAASCAFLRSNPRSVRPVIENFSLDQLELAGAAAPHTAFIRQADAGTKSCAQQVFAFVACEFERRVGDLHLALRRLPDAAAVAAPAQTGSLPSAPAPQASTFGRTPDLPGPTEIKPVAPPVRRTPAPTPAAPKQFNLLDSSPAGSR